MQNSGRGGYRRGGRNGPSLRQQKMQICGGPLVPSVEPPVITSQPWNSAIIMYQASSTNTISYVTLLDIKTKMLNQMGFSKLINLKTNVQGNPPVTDYINFDLRIQGLSMWAFSNVHLMIQPLDFTSSTGNVELARVESHAQKNMYARVGYSYPYHISGTPISTSSDAKLAAFVTSSASDVELHLRVLWKGADTGLAVKKTVFDYVPLCRALRTIADDIERPTSSQFEIIVPNPEGINYELESNT